MQIKGTTKLFGLIGHPVSHSYSPAMHNAAAAAAGLDLVYVPLPVRPQGLAAALEGLRALGFGGVNVTIPHKERVIGLIETVDAAALRIGAVNMVTIDPRSGKMRGGNSDWQGFSDDLQRLGVAVGGARCLVLGAGGSARAVVYALLALGAQVQIVARRQAQAQQLCAELGPAPAAAQIESAAWERRAELATTARLIVNTTPIGMHGAAAGSPLPPQTALSPQSFVYDLVYNPAQTALLQQAAQAGCAGANGIGMLLGQAQIAFREWTGVTPDLEVMRQALPQF